MASKISPVTNGYPSFDEGEQAAIVLLEQVNVFIKHTPKGMQLRFGERGRLTEPEGYLAPAIMALIEEGPTSRTLPVYLELHLAAALALSDSPEDDVFAAVDEALDLAAHKRSSETDSTPAEKAGIVLAFPPKRKPKNDD